ncbi:DUF2637 domain-containing protein [Rhodococcus sp. NPDC056960]|uniref:DUF2637 domain-containing protein n=1 Tax=Rhodococcus sp. NPDC056960 TaxID=3345982 RepID=UPI003636E2BB
MIGRRITPATVAVAGTAGIGLAAFWLSFAALTDLAHRSGITVPWLGPLIVDGLILTATVAVVAHSGGYAWTLLAVGAAMSLAGNMLHAALPEGPLPVWLRAAVAAIPPLALVAVTHLAVHLRRHTSATTVQLLPPQEDPIGSDDAVPTGEHASDPSPADEPAPVAPPDAKARGLALLAAAAHPKDVADQLGVNVSTVYRWAKAAQPATTP